MNITLKFVGPLKRDVGKEKIFLEGTDIQLAEIIKKITKNNSVLRGNIFDETLEDPKLIAMILINGVDINVINGLKSIVKAGDEVVFIPIVHGG